MNVHCGSSMRCDFNSYHYNYSRIAISLDFLQELAEEAIGNDKPSKEEFNHTATNEENTERPRESGMGNDMENYVYLNGMKKSGNGSTE